MIGNILLLYNSLFLISLRIANCQTNDQKVKLIAMTHSIAVVFDFDGTLFSRDQNTAYLRDATFRFNSMYGTDISTDEFAALIFSEANITNDLRHRISLDEEVPKEIYRRLQAAGDNLLAPSGLGINLYAREIDPSRWYPDPYLLLTLKKLRSNNIKIGLLSNCGWDVTTVLQRHNIMTYFNSCALSYQIGHRKPEPESFKIICEQLGVAPQNALMVGDKPAREQPAVDIGMHHLNVDFLHGGTTGLTTILPYAAALRSLGGDATSFKSLG